ncbi:sperm flagellar protein 1-like isoform X8 [Mya arenaria]|uniref:sperm flagellar protein 1-like isoform X8 n=1 Tax=Mya arenaria TaxID=6604 RepID=UPI0022E86398|nr:sperm flagellar protein 1-like isoform X8 [Mya arenaria]
MASRTKGGKGAKGHDHHNHQAQSDVPEKMEQPLDEQELESLYAWVDSIPLSRPKRNIARDFSDGVLVAEIVRHFFANEGIVELHNYTAANATPKKKENWYYLNRKVFGKMNFELADDVINDLVCCKQGMIEKVLLMLQVKIKRAQYARQHQSDKPEADQHTSMSPGRKDGRTIKVGMDDTKGRLKTKHEKPVIAKGSSKRLQDQKPKPKKTGPAVIPKKRPGPIVESDSVPRYVVEEKEQEVLSRDETIQMLQNKVQKLEQLLTLKDMRISELTEKQYINSTSSNGPSNYGKHRNYNNPHQYGGYR